MTTTRTALAGVAAAAVLAACGGTDDATAGAAPVRSHESPAASDEATTTPADGVTTEDTAAATNAPGAAADEPATEQPTATDPVGAVGASVSASPADPADEGDGGEGLDAAPTGSADPVEADPVGGPVLFTAVRVAAQDGFDRVVLEYEGDGVPGYRFSYETEATQQASGIPVDLPGATGLSGIVRGIDWTSDDNYAGPERLGAEGTESVTQVDVGVLFEGDQDPYIGVREEKPFRVTVLDDPTRIVVDVAH